MDPERVKALFESLDPEGKGYLEVNDDQDLAQIRRTMWELKIPCSISTIRDFLKSVDLNHDGRVSFAEFNAFILLRQDALRKAFEQLDVSNDGRISPKDLRIVCERLQIPLSDNDISNLIAAADSNDSGHVEFDEFCDMLILLGDTHVEGIFQHWLRHSNLDDGDVLIPPGEDNVSSWVTLTAGGTAGAVSRTVTAPMDRLKVILQAQTGPRNAMQSSGSRTQGSTAIAATASQRVGVRPGILHGFREIYLEGGTKGFFRGNGVNCLKITPETAVKFWAYESSKPLLCDDPDSPSLIERFLCGAIAGALSQSAIYPLEITKTRMALSKRGEYRSIFHCLMSIWRTGGPISIYRGLGASVFGIIPYSGVDLTVYSLLKDWYAATYPHREPGVSTLLGCGAIATTCGQLVAYPFQLIRTRLQAQGMAGRPIRYSGILDCLSKTVSEEGIAGLYRGLLPNFMKALPAISISYAVYETAKKGLM